MACIKCGKDVANGGEFCEECLVEMEQYPVKPGTPVILPKREEYATAKHSRKKTVKSEVQIAHRKSVGLAIGYFCCIAATDGGGGCAHRPYDGW